MPTPPRTTPPAPTRATAAPRAIIDAEPSAPERLRWRWPPDRGRPPPNSPSPPGSAAPPPPASSPGGPPSTSRCEPQPNPARAAPTARVAAARAAHPTAGAPPAPPPPTPVTTPPPPRPTPTAPAPTSRPPTRQPRERGSPRRGSRRRGRPGGDSDRQVAHRQRAVRPECERKRRRRIGRHGQLRRRRRPGIRRPESVDATDRADDRADGARAERYGRTNRYGTNGGG